jgi:hypothetical protein
VLQASLSPQLLETILMSVSTISLGINGFFLKQVWDDMKEIKKDVQKHDKQIIRLETLQENGL